jgi:tetraacyldisaccharide 4'-kinase
VVVVGNLYVGGTGKTPLTITLVHALIQRGYRPGVVSRGYGRGSAHARLVEGGATAGEVGDEPLLIAQSTGRPVAVGRDRVAAARLLLTMHPDIDVVLADDGLQHLRLARDFEIALIHYRGLGNGWLLPAGPLRDPPERLEQVDAVVFHGGQPTVRIHSPFFRLTTEVADAYALAEPAQRMTLAALGAEQRARNLQVLAACGIGMPDRFFGMLRDAGLDIDELSFHDHYDFSDLPFAAVPHNRILITEKDAVKCRDMPPLRADLRLWVVPLRVTLDLALIDLIAHRIGPPRHGSAPA